MAADDLRVKADAQRIFIRHWLKAEKVTITNTRGLLTIRGRLEKRAEHGANVDKIDESYLKRIEVQLMGIKGVTGVRWSLDEPLGGR
jgi:hypothetical protein